MSNAISIQMILNDAGVFWPLPQILDAMNEAQLWCAAQTKWARKSWDLELVTGTDLFTLPTDVLIPGWIEKVQIVNGAPNVKRAFPTTQRELENSTRLWRGATADAPLYFVIWDAFTLRLYPRPDQDYTYNLWGVGYPTEIVDSTTEIEGPHPVHHIVENFTLARLLEATRPDLADFYMKIAEDEIVAFRRQLRNQQSHNIKRLRPVGGVMGNYSTLTPPGRFDLQQGGSIQALPTYYPVEC